VEKETILRKNVMETAIADGPSPFLFGHLTFFFKLLFRHVAITHKHLKN